MGGDLDGHRSLVWAVPLTLGAIVAAVAAVGLRYGPVEDSTAVPTDVDPHVLVSTGVVAMLSAVTAVALATLAFRCFMGWTPRRIAGALSLQAAGGAVACVLVGAWRASLALGVAVLVSWAVNAWGRRAGERRASDRTVVIGGVAAAGADQMAAGDSAD